MFARPKSADRHRSSRAKSPRQPHFKAEINQILKKVGLEQKQPEPFKLVKPAQPTRGHHNNVHMKSYIYPSDSRKGYKVVGYRMGDNREKILYDIETGIEYWRGKSSKSAYGKKINNFVYLYDSPTAAKSERFPYNEYGDEKLGRPQHQKLLAAFDAWGTCQRRLGGGPCVTFENVKLLSIVEYLDRVPFDSSPRPSVFFQYPPVLEPHHAKEVSNLNPYFHTVLSLQIIGIIYK
jgi:hypothetical protein